jgi:hypothetical protein
VSAALKVLMKGVQANEAAADEEELEELVRGAFCLLSSLLVLILSATNS